MSSLRVLVVRYDDKIITEMGLDTFMERLTRRLLDTMPDHRRKFFLKEQVRDEQIAMALREAWLSLRTDLFTVGFKLSTWVDE
jgi:hypothetical protein